VYCPSPLNGERLPWKPDTEVWFAVRAIFTHLPFWPATW
jgi:hypothetical protein